MTGAGPPLAGLVLAAGAGTRLLPLTSRRPKPLCPVANRPLLDHAVGRVLDALAEGARRAAHPRRGGLGAAPVAADVAVNVCHGRAQLEAHLGARWPALHVSVEEPALGTAGAIGPLRAWLDGRALLIVNGDTWCPASLVPFVAGWDGERVAVAVSGRPPLHARSGIVASILPGADAATVASEPAGLWERFWRDRLAAGALQSFGVDGPFVDCATPADYLRANLLAIAGGDRAGAEGAAEPGAAAGGVDAGAVRGPRSLVHPTAVLGPHAVVERSVVGAGATVEGHVTGSVLWPGTSVGPGERLVGCVRADDALTVSVG